MGKIIWEDKKDKDTEPHKELKNEEETVHIKCTVKRRTFKVSEQRN